jgi:multiple sugar transport system substrate-binding protein
MRSRAFLGAAAAGACALAIGACGGSDGGGGSEQDAATAVEGAKVIDVKSMESPPKGTIKYCQGKDTTGDAKAKIAAFNEKFGSEGYKATLTEFPADAGQQRQQFIQRQQAKSDDCDVFSADVIWTAEFASQKWIYDLTPYIEAQGDKFIQAPLETVNYGDKYWGVPFASDAAFIYYQPDKIGGGEPPSTWQGIYEQAKESGGIVYQGAPYEGLTCNFLEIMFAAGGQVLSEDGTKSEFDSPETVKALQFMADGIKDGAAPKAVTTYMEPETDQAWSSGKHAFMRNWPYAYAVHSAKDDKTAGKYKVMPLPEFEGGGKAGILGGHNSVISVYTKNPGLALKFADFSASSEWQKEQILKFSLASVVPDVYEDAEVKKAFPYAPQLLQALSQAKARPVSPVYTQISQAIYKNVNDALAGRVSAEDAVKKADDEITKALSTF